MVGGGLIARVVIRGPWLPVGGERGGLHIWEKNFVPAWMRVPTSMHFRINKGIPCNC